MATWWRPRRLRTPVCRQGRGKECAALTSTGKPYSWGKYRKLRGLPLCVGFGLSHQASETQPHPVHIEIDNGSGVESEHLAHDQAADDCDTERAMKLRTSSGTY